jgi:hypothetical protein
VIPADGYTIAIVNLLVFIGLVGIFKPTWFVVLSRFPFWHHHRDNEEPMSEGDRRRTRRWGLITLLGALFLVVLMNM